MLAGSCCAVDHWKGSPLLGDPLFLSVFYQGLFPCPFLCFAIWARQEGRCTQLCVVLLPCILGLVEVGARVLTEPSCINFLDAVSVSAVGSMKISSLNPVLSQRLLQLKLHLIFTLPSWSI